MSQNKQSKPKPPTFYKHQVGDLLDMIAGGKDVGLSREQYIKWHELIDFAVWSMRAGYEGIQEHSALEYYGPCWQQLDAANTPDEILAALNELRDSIRMD